MYILLSGCQNPDILRIILLFKKILDIVCIIIPIGLIIFLIIDIIKMMITAEQKQNKTLKTIINRIVYAVLIFFAPTIVTSVMNLISNAGIDIGQDFNVCIVNANKDMIQSMQELQDELDRIEEERLKEELKNQLSNSGDYTGLINGSNSGNWTEEPDNTTNEDGEITDNNNQGQEGYEGIEQSGDLAQNLANRMLQIANGEIGYVETKKKDNSANINSANIIRYTKYGEEFGSSSSAWCSAFVMWIAKNTEVNGTNLYNDVFQKEKKISNPLSATNSIYTFSSSSNLSFYYSKAYGGNYTPKKGDLLYYYNGDWDKKITSTMHLNSSDKNISGHVEIIESVNDNNLVTIGGNNSTNQTITIDGETYKLRGVTKSSNYYKLDSQSIIGYGSWYK